MRPHRFIAISDSQVSYVRMVAAGWLLGTVERLDYLENDFWRLLDWIVKDVIHILKNIINVAKEQQIEDIQRLEELLAKGDIRHLANMIEDYCREYNEFNEIALKEVKKALLVIKENMIEEKYFFLARQRMKKYLCLDEQSQSLCEAIYILDNYYILDDYFSNYRSTSNCRFLAYILGFSISKVQNIISSLLASGILDIEHNEILVSAIARNFWNEEFDESTLLGQPLAGEILPLEDFNINPLQTSHAKALLTRPGNDPVHILLYGYPGTGKTSFVRSLVNECGLRSLAIASLDNENDNGQQARRFALQACLNMVKKRKNTIIVVDEAERVLDTDDFYRGGKDKAWLNSLLERPNTKIIWLTNKVSHIDPAVKRRFSLSIHFEQLGFAERIKVWNKIVTKNKAHHLITQNEINSLALQYPVETGVIADNVSQAVSLYDDKASFLSAVKMLLKSYTVLDNNGYAKADMEIDTDFCLDGVSTQDDVHALIDKCKRIDTALRNGQTIRPGCGNILFYGVSGSGKSALAKYIASTLGRECVIKHASDLLGSHVGESEKAVADAFRQAERNGHVLVIDEADSFIYSREGAVRNWEVSLVNEFLTQLENYRGFCVCTTNRMDDLDFAMMRRFNHKLSFSYADRSQKMALYEKLLSPLTTKPFSLADKARLELLTKLTAGDFNLVRSNHDPLFSDNSKLTHGMLIDALENEQKKKLEKNIAKCIGF